MFKKLTIKILIVTSPSNNKNELVDQWLNSAGTAFRNLCLAFHHLKLPFHHIKLSFHHLAMLFRHYNTFRSVNFRENHYNLLPPEVRF